MKHTALLICFLTLFLWGCGDSSPSSQNKKPEDLKMGESINAMKQKAMDATESGQKHLDETKDAASE
ncbi:MAG: hypothetical protein KKF30_13325 [Proteobacteria bacterium]|nr:hypothetical protein [Pseudomonadota bacterium]MBU4468947.1 hypothetical protein [Pseudomonadota bacterium]MCG2751183.1 hypothetical protein [Desulfobacteraceae bacterium]